MYKRIAIIYLSYHSEPYLDELVSSLQKLTYPKDRLALVVVDNPHPEHGASFSAIQEKILPLAKQTLSEAVILPQTENLGFAGGNNVGIRWALEHDFDYVYLHNQDGFMAPNALEPLVAAMEKDPKIAIAQSLILLHPETDLINNAGNSFHYLGFGFCNQYKQPVAKFLLHPKSHDRDNLGTGELAMAVAERKVRGVRDVAYGSGAACLVRSEVIKHEGMLDEDFFLYHEDLEWSMRFRSRGYRIVLAPASKFYHHYDFGRSVGKLYYMERNRYGVMLLFFKLPTLILLLPMALALEIALWFFAARRGWLKDRRRVYRYWFTPQHWHKWLEKRKAIQQKRIVGDRFLLSFSSPGIYFQETAVENPILRYLGNPLMTVYYWVVVRGLIWW